MEEIGSSLMIVHSTHRRSLSMMFGCTIGFKDFHSGVIGSTPLTTLINVDHFDSSFSRQTSNQHQPPPTTI
jgi:hypothetical protein